MITMSDPNFQNPPWVYGPKEIMDWIDSTYPEKKKGKRDHSRKQIELKNLHIKFDFDVKHKIIEPSSASSKLSSTILRKKVIEENFDLLYVAEIILRALAKAKFRNTAKIIVDGKILYNHPEDKTDLRETIDGLDEFSDEIKIAKIIEIVAILKDVNKCIADIKIKKIHNETEHSVEIKMKGKIRGDLYHTFYNYLNEKFGIKEQT